MTSRGTNDHRSGFIGHMTITPPLNEAEREHLAELAGSSGTLRGTPTGRGDRDVPFARLGWEACGDGSRLTWNPTVESSRMMLPTLRFLIDHLLRRGAKAHGDDRTSAFTFDHVVEGDRSAACGTPRARLSRSPTTSRPRCCVGKQR